MRERRNMGEEQDGGKSQEYRVKNQECKIFKDGLTNLRFMVMAPRFPYIG